MPYEDIAVDNGLNVSLLNWSAHSRLRGKHRMLSCSPPVEKWRHLENRVAHSLTTNDKKWRHQVAHLGHSGKAALGAKSIRKLYKALRHSAGLYRALYFAQQLQHQ